MCACCSLSLSFREMYKRELESCPGQRRNWQVGFCSVSLQLLCKNGHSQHCVRQDDPMDFGFMLPHSEALQVGGERPSE